MIRTSPSFFFFFGLLRFLIVFQRRIRLSVCFRVELYAGKGLRLSTLLTRPEPQEGLQTVFQPLSPPGPGCFPSPSLPSPKVSTSLRHSLRPPSTTGCCSLPPSQAAPSLPSPTSHVSWWAHQVSISRGYFWLSQATILTRLLLSEIVFQII